MIRQTAAMTALIAGSFVPALLAQQHRYSWCLLVFVIPPIAALGHALWGRAEARAWLGVLGRSLALLLPLGWTLGYLLGGALFTYTNPQAVVGLYVPAPLPNGGHAPVPVEEFLFYLLGFGAISAQYLWGLLILEPPTPRGTPQRFEVPLWLFGVWIGVLLALLYGVRTPNWPVYAAFLLGTNLPLLAWGFRAVGPALRLRALGWTVFSTLLPSLVWEPLLALPEGWWGYQPGWLLGWYAAPGLPIEAVAVWFLAPLACGLVMTFMGLREGVLGPRSIPPQKN